RPRLRLAAVVPGRWLRRRSLDGRLPLGPRSLRPLGGHPRVRLGLAADAGELPLAAVLGRPLGVDHRGVDLGERRAVGVGHLSLRPLGNVGRKRVGLAARSRLGPRLGRSEEHTSELQSPYDLVCRLLLEKKNYSWILLHSS